MLECAEEMTGGIEDGASFTSSGLCPSPSNVEVDDIRSGDLTGITRSDCWRSALGGGDEPDGRAGEDGGVAGSSSAGC